jgi:hypothetical protein
MTTCVSQKTETVVLSRVETMDSPHAAHASPSCSRLGMRQQPEIAGICRPSRIQNWFTLLERAPTGRNDFSGIVPAFVAGLRLSQNVQVAPVNHVLSTVKPNGPKG